MGNERLASTGLGVAGREALGTAYAAIPERKSSERSP